MHLRDLHATEPDEIRYVEELRLPYHRALAAAVEGFGLEDVVDDVPEEVEFVLGRFENEDVRTWVAVYGPDDGDDGYADDGNDDIANDGDDDIANDGDDDIANDGDDDIANDGDDGIAEAGGDLVGFILTTVDEAPTIFDQPDRPVVCDVYVAEPHRASGLAEVLMARAAADAREAGCEEIALDVDVENERAIGFYEKWGFEPIRHRMAVDVGEL